MITNIESTGFNSLFKATERLAQQAIDANVPTQKEKGLKADNRSLSRNNISLEAQNKLLEERNERLEKDNDNLSREVREEQTKQTQRLDDSGFNDYSQEKDTRSEEKARAANEIQNPSVATSTSDPIQPESTVADTQSYTSGSDLSGVELGNTFNAFA